MRLIALAAALALASPAAIASPQAPNSAGYVTESSENFAAATRGATLIDVRQPTEWAATGLPASAKGVSLTRPDFIEAVLAEVGGDKSRPVAVICRSGARSVQAADKLVAAGFTNVTNVGDGMIGREGVGVGWLAAKLPTRTYTPVE